VNDPASNKIQTVINMIIKNLGKQLRDQNWTSVVIEIAVVVIGILIAFQIEEWGTQREERRQELNSLQAILRDLEIGDIEYRNYLATLERTHQAQLQTLSLMQNEQTLSAEEIARRAELPNDFSWQPTDTAFNSVRSTGSLELIADPELQTAIVSYYDTFVPFFLDLHLGHSALRQEFQVTRDQDFSLIPGPDFATSMSDFSRQLRISPEAWPSHPDFWNTLVRLDIYTASTIERAEQGLEEVADLRSQINSYFEDQGWPLNSYQDKGRQKGRQETRTPTFSGNSPNVDYTGL